MTTQTPMPIILDTDLSMGIPGSEIDDGFALALALADPAVEVTAITCVNGNTDVESAVMLSKQMLRLFGRADIPVYRGASAPLCHPEKRRGAPEQIRRALGHNVADEGYAAARIAEMIAARPGELSIVAIGPLTNIATAISLNPDLPEQVRELVIMGGSYFGIGHSAAQPGEFNFWTDPEAANVVMRTSTPKRLVGLDVTTQVRITRDEAKQMATSPNDFERMAGQYTAAWIDHLAGQNPGDAQAAGSCALHDPLAVAALAHPELVEWVPANVGVIDGPSIGRGMTVTDLLGSVDAPPRNALVARSVDAPAFRELFFSRIRELAVPIASDGAG